MTSPSVPTQVITPTPTYSFNPTMTQPGGSPITQFPPAHQLVYAGPNGTFMMASPMQPGFAPNYASLNPSQPSPFSVARPTPGYPVVPMFQSMGQPIGQTSGLLNASINPSMNQGSPLMSQGMHWSPMLNSQFMTINPNNQSPQSSPLMAIDRQNVSMATINPSYNPLINQSGSAVSANAIPAKVTLATQIPLSAQAVAYLANNQSNKHGNPLVSGKIPENFRPRPPMLTHPISPLQSGQQGTGHPIDLTLDSMDPDHSMHIVDHSINQEDSSLSDVVAGASSSTKRRNILTMNLSNNQPINQTNNWRSSLSSSDRLTQRAHIRQVLTRHIETNNLSEEQSRDQLINLAASLDEELLFSMAESRLDYLKMGVDAATKIKQGPSKLIDPPNNELNDHSNELAVKIDPSNNPPINQTINQTIKPSTEQPSGESGEVPVEDQGEETTDESVDESINQSNDHPELAVDDLLRLASAAETKQAKPTNKRPRRSTKK